MCILVDCYDICECCYRNSTKIFIGNIRNGTTSDELLQAFEQYGTVTEADVVGGYGFVVRKHACYCSNLIHFLTIFVYALPPILSSDT